MSNIERIKKGVFFLVSGHVHEAGEDAHQNFDEPDNPWIVYDTNGDSWFEEDVQAVADEGYNGDYNPDDPEDDPLLKTEWSERFEDIRKKAMVLSYYKYGPAARDYPDRIDAIESLKMRLKRYEETGNTEFLADVANFAMLEFMFPRHPKAHYKPTDSDESPGVAGMGVEEIKRFKEENYV